MKKVFYTLERNGLRDNVKIIVSGATANKTYSRQIGADGCALDVGENADATKMLLTSLRSTI